MNLVQDIINHLLIYETGKAKIDQIVFKIFEDLNENLDEVEFDWYDKSITIDLMKEYPKEIFKPLFEVGIQRVHIRKHLIQTITVADKDWND
jgi:hypothetical protein